LKRLVYKAATMTKFALRGILMFDAVTSDGPGAQCPDWQIHGGQMEAQHVDGPIQNGCH
jgi:hypothetical protein